MRIKRHRHPFLAPDQVVLLAFASNLFISVLCYMEKVGEMFFMKKNL